MEQIKQFIKDCLNYLIANPVLAIVLGVVAVAIVVTVIVLIVKGCKNKKAKKSQAEEKPIVAETPAPAPVAEPVAVTPAVEEKPAEPAETVKEEPKETAVTKEQPTQKAAAKKPAQKKTTVAKKPATEEAKPQEAKAEAVKPTTPKAEKAEAKKPTRYNGKWVVYSLIPDGVEEESTFYFELLASNGEKLLSSEEYTSYNGAVAGIATYKANIEKGNFRITPSKKGDYIFKLLNGKNTLLCTGANYATRARCESAVESTKRFAATAQLVEGVEELHVTPPAEDDGEQVVAPDNGYIGKWIVYSSTVEGEAPVYYFELYASNGEKLLSSEEYTTYVGAVNGIATHKANIEKGNFRISLTKKGDYIFKLLNGNGQLLCLGEHYKTKRRCESAVESVKRFAKNAPVFAASDLAE